MARSLNLHSAGISQITAHKTRLILIELMLDINLRLAESISPRHRCHMDTVFVAQAVYFGHLSGAPFTESKLAFFLKLPRSTVRGRLEFLLRHDYILRVNGHYLIAERFRKKPIYDDLPRMASMVRMAARRLDGFA